MMIAIGIALFALLILVHEFGHFIVARRNGIKVEEFGIGFPPRLFSKQAGETRYSFNLLPLGGFVKLKGESDSDRGPESFGATSYWTKARVLMAGVGMNFLAAFMILLGLAFVGLPNLIEGQFNIARDQTIVSEGVVVANIDEDGAAEAAGIGIGDEIIRVDDEAIDSSQHLAEATERRSGEGVDIEFISDGDIRTVGLTLGSDADDGYLGVVPVDLQASRYTWSAPLIALGLTVQMTGLVLLALWNILSGLLTGAGAAAADGVAGPVGIVFLLQNLGDLGLAYLFLLIASISVSLAVFNGLPIPALDGGRLAVITGFRLAKKTLTEKTESSIHGIGFMALLALLILITYVDVQRLF